MFINFSQADTEGRSTISKPALVFVEGEHTDSSKRTHFFSQDRIKRIVANTNEFFNQGRRIPFQLDHKKDQANNIGDVESNFYTKTISAGDLPNPLHKHLIGKLGVFVDSIVAKGQEAVQQVVDKNIKTLSPGIDPATESFIEISATPIPAIVGPSLFSQSGEEDDNIILFESSFLGEMKMGSKDAKPKSHKGKAFSFEQLKDLNKNMDEVRKDYTMLSDGLFKILSDIRSSSEEELQGLNPVEASYDAIETFVDELEEMFSLAPEEENQAVSESGLPLNTSRPFPVGVQPSDFSKGKLKTVGFTLNKQGR